MEAAVDCRRVEPVAFGREQRRVLRSQRDANAAVGQCLDAFGALERRPVIESVGEGQPILLA